MWQKRFNLSCKEKKITNSLKLWWKAMILGVRMIDSTTTKKPKLPENFRNSNHKMFY